MGTEYYRPLTTLTLAVELAVWGPSPLAMHAGNLVLFLGCLFLVGRVAVQVTGRESAAWIICMVFGLLHPGAAATVCWISNRAVLLCAFFMLAAHALFLSFGKTGNKRLLGLAAAAHVLALVSKEEGLVFPVVAVALGMTCSSWRRIVPASLLFFLIDAGYFFFRLGIDNPTPLGGHLVFLILTGPVEGLRILGSHLASVFTPDLDHLGRLGWVATILCAAGLLGLLLGGIRRLPVRAVFWTLVAVILACIPGGIAPWNDMNTFRLGFIPILLGGVVVAVVSRGSAASGRWRPVLPLLLLTAGMVMMTCAHLQIRRVSGQIAARIVGSLREADRRCSRKEVFLFVEPPRYYKGLALFPPYGQGIGSVLGSPFVQEQRAMLQATEVVAQDLAAKAGLAANGLAANGRSNRQDVRVFTWRSEKGVGEALLPASRPPGGREWRGDELSAWTVLNGYLRSPRLGVSSLGMECIEVELAGEAPEGRATVRIEGPQYEDDYHYPPSTSGPEEDPAPRYRRIVMPLVSQPGWSARGRVDHVGLHIEGVSPRSIAAIRIRGVMRIIGLEASVDAIPGRPDPAVLALSLEISERDYSCYRVEFYYYSIFLSHLVLPASRFERSSGNRLTLRHILDEKVLRNLRLSQIPRVLIRIEAFKGKPSPTTLRARSLLVQVTLGQ